MNVTHAALTGRTGIKTDCCGATEIAMLNLARHELESIVLTVVIHCLSALTHTLDCDQGHDFAVDSGVEAQAQTATCQGDAHTVL